MPSDYSPVSVDKFKEIVESGQARVLLDVRTAAELLDKRTPFVDIHIPYDQLDLFTDLLPKDKDTGIYIICRAQRRSGIALHFLIAQGYTNVHVVYGGMVEWELAGHETVSGAMTGITSPPQSN